MKKEGKVGISSKKAQIFIFVIIAIVIIAAALLLFFWSNIKGVFVSVSPEDYIKNCVEKETLNAIKTVELNGGGINPQNYYLFGGEKIEYLCYINENYKTCVMQRPLLKQYVQEEVGKDISEKVKGCMESFKTEYEKRGYSISVGNTNTSVDLVPENLKLGIKVPVTITKDTTSKYNEFSWTFNTKLYDLLMIASSILNWEARFGNSETTDYMDYYPNIKVEKIRQEDGTKVYIITDRPSGERFRFATRSIAWPAGLGYGELNTPVRENST